MIAPQPNPSHDDRTSAGELWALFSKLTTEQKLNFAKRARQQGPAFDEIAEAIEQRYGGVKHD